MRIIRWLIMIVLLWGAYQFVFSSGRVEVVAPPAQPSSLAMVTQLIGLADLYALEGNWEQVQYIYTLIKAYKELFELEISSL